MERGKGRPPPVAVVRVIYQVRGPDLAKGVPWVAVSFTLAIASLAFVRRHGPSLAREEGHALAQKA